MKAKRHRASIAGKGMFPQGFPSDDERGGKQDLVRQYRIEVGKKPLLTRQQEMALAKKKDKGFNASGKIISGSFLTQKKDLALAKIIEVGEEARNQLVEGNLRFVAKIANEYIGNGLSYLDLIQIGNEALIESVDKFDYKTGYRVLTYAGRNIAWGIKKALAKQSRLVRYPMHHHEKLPTFEKITNLPHAEKLSDAEIAQKMGVSEAVARDLRELANYTLAPLYDSIPLESPSHEAVIYTQQRDRKIQERIKALPKKERVVITRRYGFDGESEDIKSLHQVARELGIPFSTTRVTEIKAFTRLKEALKEI